MAKEKLLTGCHGDCCQALAQTVLGERETERERDEAGHSQAETKRRKRQDELGPLTACQTHMHAQTHTQHRTMQTLKKTATKKNYIGIFKSVFQSHIHKKGVNFLVFQDKKTKQNKPKNRFGTPECVSKPISLKQMKGENRLLSGNKVTNIL